MKKGKKQFHATFLLKVIRVDEYEGQPVFVVDYHGKERRLWKRPDQPADTKFLTCELYKSKNNGVTYLRQYHGDNNPKAESLKPNSQNPALVSLDLKMHKYGNNARCNVCGRLFESKKGWKADYQDIFVCNECRNDILKKPGSKSKNNTKKPRIIYTPMGNRMR